jgi:hypothetical protein
MGGPVIRILLPSIVLLAGVAQAIDITTCGQTVPSFDIGVLQTDLVCPNPNTADGCLASGMGAPAAVDLQANATLQMNGHSITGGCYGVRAFTGSSRRRLAIQGPGLITGAFLGVFFEGRLTISDVTLDGNGAGIVSPDPSTNQSRIFATNVAANSSVGPIDGSGISAYRIDATSVTANGNVSAGIYAASRLRANGVTANDDAYGLYSPGKVAIDGLTATNSTYYGVAACRLRLRTSTVTGSQSGIDLWTRSRPSTTAVTCDHSGSQTNPPIPWGVCAGD